MEETKETKAPPKAKCKHCGWEQDQEAWVCWSCGKDPGTQKERKPPEPPAPPAEEHHPPREVKEEHHHAHLLHEEAAKQEAKRK